MKRKRNMFWIIKYVIPSVFLLALCLYHIYDNQLIKICGDEFGYWAAGSWFAGYDWSEVQGINKYYGYGYGLILAVILKFTSDQTVAYQIALGVNAMMVCVMYFLAIRVEEIIDKEEKLSNIIKIIIALTSVLFSSNLFYTQFTLTETILALAYWIIFYNFILLIDKFTILRMISFYFLALISVSIHLRTIGVFLICIIMGTIILYKHKVTGKKILFIVLFLSMGSMAVSMLKKVYQNSYISSIIIPLNVNELTGQIGKIKFVLTGKGIKTLFEGVCGKLFYAVNSTFLLAAIPICMMINCFKKNIVSYRNKKEFIFGDIDLVVFFLLSSTLSELLIDAIFMINYDTRFDLLTYGRYFEYTLTPLILLGFYMIFCSYERIERYVVFLAFFNLLFSIYVNKLQNYDAAKTHVHMNITAFYEMLMKRSYAGDSWLAVGLKSILIISCFVILSHSNKNHKYMKNVGVIGLMIISVLWIREAKFVYEKAWLSWTMEFQEKEIELANNIIDAGIQDKLIFYNEGNNLKIMPLQFLLKEYTIKVESDMDVIESNGNNYVLSVQENAEGMGDLDEAKYEMIGQSKWLRLWRKR